MMAGLALPILVLTTFGGVDLSRATTVRSNLQDALDAAALAAARSPAATNAELRAVGLDALKGNLAAFPEIELDEDSVTFTVTTDDVVIADASVKVKTLVANIVLPPYGQFMDDTILVGGHSEVDRASRDVEVGLVLDITGSMAGNRIRDLKTAAANLVDIVVQDQQTPFYSRLALVPYSVGVNMGGYAEGARGALTQSTAISGVAWSTGTAKAITAVTGQNPSMIVAPNHGFQNGDTVWLANALGQGRAVVVSNRQNSKFEVQGSANLSGYTLGTATKCLVANCHVVVTSANHGLANGDGVYITGVVGPTTINNKPYVVGDRTANSFSIGVTGVGWLPYVSGGSAWCGRDGCQWRVFRNPSNELRALVASTCVSERAGAQKYTEASPSSARVGRNYAPSGNACPEAVIQPLTDNKSGLKSQISDLGATGSTAGQIGIGWGWYSVSPNFNSLWPSNPAAAYDNRRVLKAVVIMTDGEFNTPYCTGVISRDAGSGSGANDDKIDCASDNGDVFAQGLAMCQAMKAQNVVVYTVGFQIAANGAAANLLSRCATSSAHAYLPRDGGDLNDAFIEIGRDITKLRISR